MSGFPRLPLRNPESLVGQICNLPSLEISHDFQAFDGMTQKILNLKVLWIGLE